jgi:hypothetical protein
LDFQRTPRLSQSRFIERFELVFEHRFFRPKSPRSREVQLWLKRHPQVTRYAVIDDEEDGLDALPLFQPHQRPA